MREVSYHVLLIAYKYAIMYLLYLCGGVYTKMKHQQTTLSKREMLQTLTSLGLTVPRWTVWTGNELRDDALTDYLTDQKNSTDFEIDGIVVDVDDVSNRSRLNQSAKVLNPAYSFKYKIADAENYAETELTWIELRLSKHGYIKPRFHVKPVDLVGVTITHATGLNAKYILDNKLRPGTKVSISRCGDVVPNVTGILGQSEDVSDRDYKLWFDNQMDQFGPWVWSETAAGQGVDAKVADIGNNKTITCKQLLDFFEKIDVAYLGMGNITKLYESGLDTPEEIIDAAEATLVKIIGKNGSKVYNSIASRLNGIPLYQLIGAHSTQRGIGVRKMRTLELVLGDNFTENPSISKYKAVEKFDTITATGAVAAVNAFKDFYERIEMHVILESAVATGSSVAGIKFCFTGFRNKDLQQQIESAGGTVGSSVSKNTNFVVTADPSGTSGKLKKARDLNIPIIEEHNLVEMLA